MAEGEKKHRSPLPLVAALIVIVVGLAAVIWLTRPQTPDPASLPAPEMGPDTAQAPAPTAVAQAPATPDAQASITSDTAVSTASAGGSSITFADETLSFSAALPE